MSTELVFDDPPPPRRRHHGGGYLFPAAVCLLVAGVAVGVTLWAVKTGRLDVGRVAALGAITGPTERDRDYFRILIVSYDIHSLLVMQQAWVAQSEKVAWLNETGAAKDVIAFTDRVGLVVDGLNRAKIRLRQEFIDRHGLDPKDYTKQFAATYPERDAVFDEIEQAVTDRCRSQALAVAEHLSKYSEPIFAEADGRGGRYVRDRMAAYRADYFPKQAERFAEQARAAGRAASGLKRLHAKLD